MTTMIVMRLPSGVVDGSCGGVWYIGGGRFEYSLLLYWNVRNSGVVCLPGDGKEKEKRSQSVEDIC